MNIGNINAVRTAYIVGRGNIFAVVIWQEQARKRQEQEKQNREELQRKVHVKHTPISCEIN